MSIADNKKAFHDYFIEEKFEAGIVLEGGGPAGAAELVRAFRNALNGGNA